MKQVYWATAVWVILLAGVITNALMINARLRETEGQVALAYRYALAGDMEASGEVLSSARELWQATEKTISWVVNRRTCAGITDAFSETVMALDDHPAEALSRLLEGLRELRRGETTIR